MRTSYSALNTYQTCPLKFKFQEIDRIAVLKGIEAVFGAIVHNCLKFMFERSPLYPTLDEVINRFQELWSQKIKQDSQTEEEKSYCEDGISILKNFYQKNQPWNFNVLSLESKFEVLLPESPAGENNILVGIIDRIDKNPNGDTYEIIDYKTSRRMPSQADLDKDLQMSIYHLGITNRWPHIKPENIKLSLYFLKHGEKITTARSQKNLEETKEFIIGIIGEIKERIKNNDFPSYPSPLCGWCGHRVRCPMWKHEYQKNKSEAKNKDELEKIIQEYFTLKGQNTKNNKRIAELQTYVYDFMAQESVERVFGESGYLTRSMQERVVYNMDKIKKILEEMGKWEEVISKKKFTTLKATKKKKAGL